ncbi:MAG: PadR family transcriptional regulator [Bacillaceae bacterium]
MSTQFKKGVLDLCVLAQIAKRDMYGYEIVQTISTHMEVNESTIYPILRRLTKEGYFETYMQESSEGPARKYYKLTESGKVHLHTTYLEWTNFSKAVMELLKGVEENES